MSESVDDPPAVASSGSTRRLSRRELLGAGLGGAVVLAGAGYGVDRALSGGGHGLPPNGTPQRFVSRPDLIPTIVRYTASRGASPGLLFVGPDRSSPVQGGAMILDGPGLVWFSPVAVEHWATNLQVRTLHGRPVLTWWEGRLDGGYGAGEAVIADTSYRILYRLPAANERTVDLHEFQLTDDGRALFTCTPQTVNVDLSSVGGPRSGLALESIFQELDVASGRLIREWRSLDHIPVAESYRRGQYAPYDYLHLNTIDVLPDGNLLVGARNTWAAYKLDRRTGDIMWRLGGKRSDFHMGPGAQFAWQHDTRLRSPGTMTVFDDGFDGVTKTHRFSRGLVLSVDERARRVAVTRSVRSPAGLLSSGMGNTQMLDNGHLVVGFGDDPWVTEFDLDGHVVANLRMPQGQHSYRGFRLGWTARGEGVPAAVARRGHDGRATLYVSWNGQTTVARWRVLGGSRASDLSPVRERVSGGFETAIGLGTGSGFVQAVALNASGRELARSSVIRA